MIWILYGASTCLSRYCSLSTMIHYLETATMLAAPTHFDLTWPRLEKLETSFEIFKKNTTSNSMSSKREITNFVQKWPNNNFHEKHLRHADFASIVIKLNRNYFHLFVYKFFFRIFIFTHFPVTISTLPTVSSKCHRFTYMMYCL